MRTLTEAKHFHVGMIAFLPYWSELRKAKIIEVSRHGQSIRVIYRAFCDQHHDNMCIMKETSQYEVYSRR